MKKILPLYQSFLFLVLVSGCSDKKDGSHQSSKAIAHAPVSVMAPYDEGYPLTEENVDPDAPYDHKEYKDYYKDYYKEKESPPPFDLNMDISQKTFPELRLLRAEILARHHYLFMDYVHRAYFNATKWYQPVFWDESFRIKLSGEEKKFIDRVLAREKDRYN